MFATIIILHHDTVQYSHYFTLFHITAFKGGNKSNGLWQAVHNGAHWSEWNSEYDFVLPIVLVPSGAWVEKPDGIQMLQKRSKYSLVRTGRKCGKWYQLKQISSKLETASTHYSHLVTGISTRSHELSRVCFFTFNQYLTQKISLSSETHVFARVNFYSFVPVYTLSTVYHTLRAFRLF